VHLISDIPCFVPLLIHTCRYNVNKIITFQPTPISTPLDSYPTPTFYRTCISITVMHTLTPYYRAYRNNMQEPSVFFRSVLESTQIRGNGEMFLELMRISGISMLVPSLPHIINTTWSMPSPPQPPHPHPHTPHRSGTKPPQHKGKTNLMILDLLVHVIKMYVQGINPYPNN
jgi:hypothetical protein